MTTHPNLFQPVARSFNWLKQFSVFFVLTAALGLFYTFIPQSRGYAWLIGSEALLITAIYACYRTYTRRADETLPADWMEDPDELDAEEYTHIYRPLAYLFVWANIAIVNALLFLFY